MQDHLLFKTRREQLISKIKATMSDDEEGLVLLCGSYEDKNNRFKQESSFYYLSGITEPGSFLTIDFSGKTTLYLPKYAESRAKWVLGGFTPDLESARAGVNEIKYLGEASLGYDFSPLFKEEHVQNLLKDINKKHIFTLYPDSPFSYIASQQVLERLATMLPTLKNSYKDISGLVASMRRVKDKREIELLYKAVEYTMIAHSGITQIIEEGKKESEIQATVEYIFTEAGAVPAFPSIVAGGKNGTVLHYNQNSNILKKHELLVVDIGARFNYYCADLTRTYPVSGQFSKRQLQLYNIVLATQEFIAQQAKPGIWLNNKEHKNSSLYHLALDFLKDQGYEKYFTHGIGHYLGLDVHDVGSYAEPLAEGDVITIEPGIYIPEESIGIRIEDDYWIVKDSALCISQDLPREAEEIEAMMQEEFDED